MAKFEANLVELSQEVSQCTPQQATEILESQNEPMKAIEQLHSMHVEDTVAVCDNTQAIIVEATEDEYFTPDAELPKSNVKKVSDIKEIRLESMKAKMKSDKIQQEYAGISVAVKRTQDFLIEVDDIKEDSVSNEETKPCMQTQNEEHEIVSTENGIERVQSQISYVEEQTNLSVIPRGDMSLVSRNEEIIAESTMELSELLSVTKESDTSILSCSSTASMRTLYREDETVFINDEPQVEFSRTDLRKKRTYQSFVCFDSSKVLRSSPSGRRMRFHHEKKISVGQFMKTERGPDPGIYMNCMMLLMIGIFYDVNQIVNL
ncbi:hypothetical protein HHI36_023471 [Cryptolaemus montrouzieri]|uniref:Uncharacterized protein n=1 Tax=Cryptolaemus montrouzieri TaxID=559131 RepID=A0ABD2PH01_9CUCU